MEIIEHIRQITHEKQRHHHVYGHQDTYSSTLSLPAYLNTIADFIASHNRLPTKQIHPSSRTAVYIDKFYVPYHARRFLLSYTFAQDAAEELKKNTNGPNLLSIVYSGRNTIMLSIQIYIINVNNA